MTFSSMLSQQWGTCKLQGQLWLVWRSISYKEREHKHTFRGIKYIMGLLEFIGGFFIIKETWKIRVLYQNNYASMNLCLYRYLDVQAFTGYSLRPCTLTHVRSGQKLKLGPLWSAVYASWWLATWQCRVKQEATFDRSKIFVTIIPFTKST